MVSRRTAVLLAALVCALAVVGFAGATGDPAPELTVENEAQNTSYVVTAYTASDRTAAGYANFEVTTDEGERRLVTYADLVWPSGHRNVTLADDDVSSHAVSVGPGENVTTSVDGWDPGDVTMYVVERGDERVHHGTRTVTCTSRGQDHTITFDGDSGFGSSSTCGGGVGWLFD